MRKQIEINKSLVGFVFIILGFDASAFGLAGHAKLTCGILQKPENYEKRNK